MSATSFATQFPAERISARAVIALLSPTLGWEKSEESVTGAMKLLDLPDELDVDQAHAILDLLSRIAGVVGVTARFARSRADFGRAAAASRDAPPRTIGRPPASAPSSALGAAQASPVRPPVPPSWRDPTPVPDAPASARGSAPGSAPTATAARFTISLDEVAGLLAHTVGLEKSREAVRASAKRAGIWDERVDREQASRLFDDLARQDGIVGITARFGKARLILRFGG